VLVEHSFSFVHGQGHLRLAASRFARPRNCLRVMADALVTRTTRRMPDCDDVKAWFEMTDCFLCLPDSSLNLIDRRETTEGGLKPILRDLRSDFVHGAFP